MCVHVLSVHNLTPYMYYMEGVIIMCECFLYIPPIDRNPTVVWEVYVEH